MSYFSKMRGITKSPPRAALSEVAWSFMGAFLGISAVGYINYSLLEPPGNVLMFGPFGASAVLIYGVIKSPLAQPRNLLGGHILAALIGVAAYKIFSPNLWLAASVAVALAVATMHLTRTLHPPAGATALIAVIGDEKIHSLGFAYAAYPVAAGVIVMLVIALLFNNVARNRRYPEFWF
ncbi:MAG: HPP family protein [Desulfomonile tiedjei]|uniref:HPP family protein n=1 Tax=Desulfomonile tiedjei TaxID=2358 RepID=A0A9D6V5E9_9BACT|nr:HPP family protein [Desulfomonile tiedjei]